MQEYSSRKRIIQNTGSPSGSAGRETFRQNIPNSSLEAIMAGRAHAGAKEMGHRQDLAPSLNAKMSRAFGMDFSGIQLYRTDAMQDTEAKGMASGNKVVLSADIDLNTTAGQALLGHELSHVRAQSRGIGMGHSGLYQNAGLEHQADMEGMMAARGQSILGENTGMDTGLGMGGIGGLAPLGPGMSASAGAPMQAGKWPWSKTEAKPPETVVPEMVADDQGNEVWDEEARWRDIMYPKPEDTKPELTQAKSNLKDNKYFLQNKITDTEAKLAKAKSEESRLRKVLKKAEEPEKSKAEAELKEAVAVRKNCEIQLPRYKKQLDSLKNKWLDTTKEEPYKDTAEEDPEKKKGTKDVSLKETQNKGKSAYSSAFRHTTFSLLIDSIDERSDTAKENFAKKYGYGLSRKKSAHQAMNGKNFIESNTANNRINIMNKDLQKYSPVTDKNTPSLPLAPSPMYTTSKTYKGRKMDSKTKNWINTMTNHFLPVKDPNNPNEFLPYQASEHEDHQIAQENNQKSITKKYTSIQEKEEKGGQYPTKFKDIPEILDEDNENYTPPEVNTGKKKGSNPGTGSVAGRKAKGKPHVPKSHVDDLAMPGYGSDQDNSLTIYPTNNPTIYPKTKKKKRK